VGALTLKERRLIEAALDIWEAGLEEADGDDAEDRPGSRGCA